MAADANCRHDNEINEFSRRCMIHSFSHQILTHLELFISCAYSQTQYAHGHTRTNQRHGSRRLDHHHISPTDDVNEFLNSQHAVGINNPLFTLEAIIVHEDHAAEG